MVLSGGVFVEWYLINSIFAGLQSTFHRNVKSFPKYPLAIPKQTFILVSEIAGRSEALLKETGARACLLVRLFSYFCTVFGKLFWYLTTESRVLAG